MSGKERTPRRPRSVVWYYFDKLVDDPYKARCKLCNVICHNVTNTSNLFYHLRHRHPASYHEAEEQKEHENSLYAELKAKAGKPVTSTSVGGKGRGKGRGRGRPPKNAHLRASASETLAVVKTETEELDDSSFLSNSKLLSNGERRTYGGFIRGKTYTDISEALVQWLAADLVHPSVISKKGFKYFLSACGAGMGTPTKKTVTETLVPQLFEETKVKVKQELQAAKSVALTLESWNYREVQAFVTVTAHMIKENWVMSSFALDTFECSEDRTETNLSNHLKRVTEEWGLDGKISVLLTGEPEEVMSSAIAVCGWEELPCFGRALNLTIGGALNSVPELARVHEKLSEAVTYFCQSSRAAEALLAVQQQHGLPSERLRPEQPNVWGSSLAAMECLLKQYEAVNTVLCFLGREHMCLCDDDVELLQGALQLLRPFEAALEELSVEPYTCMSKMIPVASLLQQVTSEREPCPAGPVEDLRLALLNQLEQMQFGGLDSRPVLATASLLDPRFKQHAFTEQTSLDSAKDYLLQLLQEVIKTSGSSAITSNTSSNTSISPQGGSTSLWGNFDQKLASANALGSAESDAENELRRFFQEVNISRSGDPLQWWRLNEVQFPHLKVLAQRFLCVPATALNSGRLFTKEGAQFSQRRNQFRPTELNSWLFLSENLV